MLYSLKQFRIHIFLIREKYDRANDTCFICADKNPVALMPVTGSQRLICHIKSS